MNVHVHAPTDERLTFVNATLVLPDGLAKRASLSIADGLIDAIEPEAATGSVVDCAGEVVMPGIVDIHTDHFEKHVFPRKHVRWPAMAAALAHDAQMIGGGVTTVFDSLCVGNSGADTTRHEILAPMIEALEAGSAAGMFKADHLVHLRCETSDEATLPLTEAHLGRPIVRIASIMDHTPGVKQSRDLGGYVERRMIETGWPREAVETEMEDIWERVSGVVERVRGGLVSLLRRRNIALLSHDDVTAEHIAEAHADGVTIAEFPTTMEAARAAHEIGMLVVAGAPNYMRGSSQSGNIAVADLLAEGLLDILASDYVPRSILDAVFRLANDPALDFDLSAAVRLATLTPARAAGLDDRGALAPRQRADLLRVGIAGEQPFVRAAWRAGLRVG